MKRRSFLGVLASLVFAPFAPKPKEPERFPSLEGWNRLAEGPRTTVHIHQTHRYHDHHRATADHDRPGMDRDKPESGRSRRHTETTVARRHVPKPLGIEYWLKSKGEPDDQKLHLPRKDTGG